MNFIKRHILVKTTLNNFIIIFFLFSLLFSIYQFGLPGDLFKGSIVSRRETLRSSLSNIALMESNSIRWQFNEIFNDLDEIFISHLLSLPDTSSRTSHFFRDIEENIHLEHHLNDYFATHPYCRSLVLHDASTVFVLKTRENVDTADVLSVLSQNHPHCSSESVVVVHRNPSQWVLKRTISTSGTSTVCLALTINANNFLDEIRFINSNLKKNNLLRIISVNGFLSDSENIPLQLPSYAELYSRYHQTHGPFVYYDTVHRKNWEIALQPLHAEEVQPLFLAVLSDMTTFDKTTRNGILLSLLFSFLGAFCAAAVLGINLRLHIRHLLELNKTAELIRHGNRDARVTINTSDEIGSLGKSFNEMLDKITTLHSSLERKVNERTETLVKTNTTLEKQLAFEQLLSSIASDFLLSVQKNIDETVHGSIERIRVHFGVAFCFLYLKTDDSQLVLREHSVRHEIPVPLFPHVSTLLMGMTQSLLSGNSVICHSLEDKSICSLSEEKIFFQKIGIHALIAVPLSVRGEIRGALITGNTSPTDWHSFTPEKLQLCGAVTMGTLLRYRHEQDLLFSRERLRSLSLEVAKSEEKNREQLAGWLHDSIGQELALIKMKLGMIQSEIRSEDIRHEFDSLRMVIDRIISDCREKIFDLNPPILREFGLYTTLNWFCTDVSDKNGISCNISFDEHLPTISYEISTILYRCIRELVINIIKHADASRFEVGCRYDFSRLHLSVFDDGNGLPDDFSNGYGLFSINERISDIGGTFSIKRLITGGTTAEITLPFTERFESVPDAPPRIIEEPLTQ